MRRWMKRSLFVVIICTIIYFGMYLYIIYSHYNSQTVDETFNEDTWVNPLNSAAITENMDVYQDDEQKQTDKLYVTVMETDKNKKESLLKNVINYTEEDVGEKPTLKVYFQDGNSNILKIFEQEPNATLEVRGKLSDKVLQKSFKIKLFDKEGLWNNQTIINLNKHYSDSLRIRNKLSFDYFKIIPDITSFRTRFVRLYINNGASQSLSFEDYGFFTQIEQPNKLFLKSHGLDPNGYLYKAEDFKFLRYEEFLRNKDDKEYSKKAFEKVLEIKGNDDHTKLIEMLEAVNDPNRNINDVVDTYFDKDNYLTWVAVNILFDNYKTQNKNYMLYSPMNSTKWYFMPWDYDEAWGLNEDRPMWEKGLAVYWDNQLHQRFFKEKENVEALGNKIDQLQVIITKEQTKAFLDSYYNILFSNITKLPDLQYLPITIDEFKAQYAKLPDLTGLNSSYYFQLIERPMPYLMNEPEYKNDRWIFKWDESYDIQGDSVYYDFEISEDRYFSTSKIIKKKMMETRCEVKGLEKGVYYWRVIARDIKDNSQIAYNIYEDDFGEDYYGIRQLVVK